MVPVGYNKPPSCKIAHVSRYSNMIRTFVITPCTGGFEYLVLDDCWMDHERNATDCPTGAPTPCWQFDRQRFPSGTKSNVRVTDFA